MPNQPTIIKPVAESYWVIPDRLLAGKHPQLASVHVVVGNLGRRLLGCVS